MENIPFAFEENDETSTPGDIESISINLRDLNIAKSSLFKEAKKISEECKAAEVKVEAVRKSASRASALLMKAEDNLKTMEMKLDSQTSNILSCESSCQGLREMTYVLQKKLKAEKEVQVDGLNNFETEIEDLKKKFVNAILFYAIKRQTAEIASQEVHYKELIQKRNNLEVQLLSAEHDLKNLSFNFPSSDRSMEIVTCGQREFLVKILIEEQCKFQHAVNAFQQKKNKANLILQQQNVEVEVM